MRALEGAAKQELAALMKEAVDGGMSRDAAKVHAEEKMVAWCQTGIKGARFSRVVQAIVR
jgi:hypothetical protein